MSSRQYIKRIWRVPKDRGASEYLAALVVKSLVKHGWPAKADIFNPVDQCEGFQVVHYKLPIDDTPPDFWAAVEVAVRIAVRTHRLNVSYANGNLVFLSEYTITKGGFFKEVKP